MSSEDKESTGNRPGGEEGSEVVDPEGYNRKQRFKEIHQARQRVAKFLTEMEIPDEGGGVYRLREGTRLAHLVSLYIMELEPLIIQSDVDDGDLVSDDADCDSLRQFAGRMGVKPAGKGKDQTPSPQETMYYFSAANRFYARIGMDLELEDGSSEAGAEYSDILDGDAP